MRNTMSPSMRYLKNVVTCAVTLCLLILAITRTNLQTSDEISNHRVIRTRDYRLQTINNSTTYDQSASTQTQVQSNPVEKYNKLMSVKGLVFTNSSKMGDLSKEFSAILNISVIKSFSPDTENHLKDIFFDEYKECEFYATIPAMLLQDGQVKVVQRVWLAQYEHFRHQLRVQGKSEQEMKNHWHNTWQENFLYEMELDYDYKLIRPGRIMGIPTTTNTYALYKSDGPMDPRLFRVGNEELLSYHSWLVDPTYNNDMAGRTHIYNLNRHVKRKLKTDQPMVRTEINWIPLDINGHLYVTYSLDPLRVMSCDPTSGQCKFIYEQKDAAKHPFVYSSDHLRGGTPWVLYKYPYYLSMGHSVAVRSNVAYPASLYNAHLLVLCVNRWRVVYVSRHLEFSHEWVTSVPVVRNHTIASPFFYPSGIIKWSDDVIDVSGHLNDYSGHVIRVRGVKKLMDGVMERDAAANDAKLFESAVRVRQQYLIDELKDSLPNEKFLGDIIAGTVQSS